MIMIALLAIMAHIQSPSVSVRPAHLHPGSPFVLTIRGLTAGSTYDVELDGRKLGFRGGMEVTLLLGIDLGHPAGPDNITVYRQGMAAPVTSVTVLVHRHSYPAQYLKLPRYFVSLTPVELKRAEREQAELERIFASDTTRREWSGRFIMPVRGMITTPFGVRRFLNGEPRAPHTGIDIAARPGTPVVATNSGTVCFEGSLFFGGGSILINHGQGIYSMYFHLRGYAVKDGARVRKGQTVGYVGSTGRVTGPSLHFGVRIVDSKIDPSLLFRLVH